MNGAPTSGRADPTIAIVVLTHNRVHLLRECVENVLQRTSPHTVDIVIWDNGSSDDTDGYLRTVADPRIRVISSPSNVGLNGYARAFATTSATYLIELDDDIVDAPVDWDRALLDAFTRLPGIGFLGADLEDDPFDVAANLRHRIRAHEYTPAMVNGVSLLRGPTGGGCAMTSREVYDRVGGFSDKGRTTFFQEDADYIRSVQSHGYDVAVLADLKVLHHGGPHYAFQSPEKDAYWRRWARRRRRRDNTKRVLLRIPMVRRLNAHRAWFEEPQ